jgi:hypothetical protein
MYAQVEKGTIKSVSHTLPPTATRLDTGGVVVGFARFADQALREACGYFDVVLTDRPEARDDVTFVAEYKMVKKKPTQVWVEEPVDRSIAEEAARARQEEEFLESIQGRLLSSLKQNAPFTKPGTDMTRVDMSDQIKALTRQVNNLIRLQLRQLDDRD